MSIAAEVLTGGRAAGHIRRKVVDWWLSLTGAEQARIKVVGFLSLVVAAFHYSLQSLMSTLAYDTPLAYIALVPVFAAGLAWLHRVPREHEVSIHDRQLDYIVGLPLMALALIGAFLLPQREGLMYWFDRFDLLLLPVFVAGAAVLIFGCRAAWRQKAAIAYLFLAWPWPYQHILLGSLNGFTNITLAGLKAVLKVVPVGKPVAGTPGLFQVVHAGRPFPISIVTACSGVDGMVGFLLVGVAFAMTVGGGRIRKSIWLLLGLALLWATNLLRLLLIFWAGSAFGEDVAINILHPVAGLIIFCMGVVLMTLLLKPFGLVLIDARAAKALTFRPTGYAPATQKVFVSLGIVAIAAFVLSVNNSALGAFNPVASASGEPKLASFLADPASPSGWKSIYNTEFLINKPLFGQSSRWFRYTYVWQGSKSLYSTMPVTADVINAGGLSGFAQYGVEDCYTFHGYLLRDVAKVNLGDGISGQALSYSGTKADSDWSIVYWIWPVATGNGTRYERVILYLQNTAQATVRVNGAVPGIKGLSGALRDVNAQQERLIENRAFLVAFARSIVQGQVSMTDRTADVVQMSYGAGVATRPGNHPTETIWTKFHVKPRAVYTPPKGR